MGKAQNFREKYAGIQFYLVKQVDGIGIYKSQVIEVNKKDVDEDDVEVFIEIIVSLDDKFKTPREMFIQDIYNTCEKIHDISQYKLVPVKTNTIYNCTINYDEETF